MRKSLFFFCLLASCSSVPRQDATQIRAGVSKVRITPERNVPLGGYGARMGRASTGVHDDVWVRALYLECDGKRLLWFTSDLCLIVAEIRDGISKDVPLKPEELLVTATHNHSGPSPYMNNPLAITAMGKYDKEFTSWLISKFVEAGTAAMADARPALAGFGTAEANLSRNRRREEITDPTVRVLRLTNPDGSHRATLAQFTAHPTVIGGNSMLVSAEYPGAFCNALERMSGGTALFCNGAEGDQGPLPPEGKDAFERAERMGQELAKIVAATKTDSRKSVRIRSVIEPVALKPSVPLFVPRSTVLQVVRLDEVLLLAVPGEMCLAVARNVEKELGEKHVWFIGLANDHLGYFVTPEQYDKGGYEKEMCFYGSNVQSVFIEHFKRLAEKIR
jgi:hypothetical protein